jgi:hypothetical protein
VEAIIHFPATLSAFLSPSLDHGALSKTISPAFEIEGVDERAIAEPTMSPPPPSIRRISTNVVLDKDPEMSCRRIGLSKDTIDAPTTGLFR